MINLLASNPTLLLFLICGVGFTAGRISINGFSFGVAAVLFVGIGAGAVSASWILPDDVWIFGLAIFVYASQNTSDENSVLRGYSTVFPVVMTSKIVTAAPLVTLLLH